MFQAVKILAMEERILLRGEAGDRDAVNEPCHGVDPDYLPLQTEGEATDLAADINLRAWSEMPIKAEAAPFLGKVTE